MGTTLHAHLEDQRIRLPRLLWRGGEWGYFWRFSDRRSYWTRADAPELPPDWSSDVIFSVHPVRVRRGDFERGRTEDVAAVNCLFADFDPAEGENADALIARTAGLKYPPNVIVLSGAGIHCYWMLRTPFTIADEADRARIADLQARWVAHVGADPAAKDLARALRVPGTRNVKRDGRMVTIARFDLDRLYTVGELAEEAFTMLAHPPTPEAMTRIAAILRKWGGREVEPEHATAPALAVGAEVGRAVAPAPPAPPPPAPKADLGTLSARQKRAIRGVLRWLAQQPEGRRNTALFWSANRLREAGLTAEGALELLAPISRARGLGEREIVATIYSAFKG